MKIYIATDNEGLAGVVGGEGPLTPDHPEYPFSCEELAREVNAAVQALADAGVDEIVVDDGHNAGRNLRPDLLDPRAQLVRGWPRPRHLPGLDRSFDGLILIGYHPMEGTERGVLAHTFASTAFEWITINDLLVGEIGTHAMVAGARGVALIMVTSCRQGVEEARRINPKLECVAVKEGLTRTCARCLSPQQACEQIGEAAGRAVRRINQFTPYNPLKAPFELKIRVKEPAGELMNEYVRTRGYEQVEPFTIRIRSDDLDTVVQAI